jgi:competence protein ComEC
MNDVHVTVRFSCARAGAKAMLVCGTLLLQAAGSRADVNIANAAGGGAELLAAAPEGVPSEGKGLLRIFMIDVSNGNFVCESLLIITPGGKAMLIDAGFPSPTFRYGGQVQHYGTNVVPGFLEARGIDTLDWMMLSHIHDDHIGDMPKFVDGDQLTVKKVLWSPLPDERILKAEPANGEVYIEPVQALRAACGRKQVPMVEVKAGDVLDLGDGVIGKILCAARPEVDVPNYINNNSIVMRLTYGDFSMLFTGDAGFEEEEVVMASGGALASDVLKIGHHAGAASNSPEWIQAVNARVGLGSMPKWLSDDPKGQKVYDLLIPTGMKFYRSWEHGHVEVQTDGQRFWVRTQK